jgi:hypothetical protein
MEIDLRKLKPEQIEQLILLGENLKATDRNTENIQVNKNSIKYKVVWTSCERELFIGKYCFLMEYSCYKPHEPTKHETPIKYDVPAFHIYKYLGEINETAQNN